MRRGLVKLSLSILAVVFTLVSLVTSTFAFVIMNSTVAVSLDFNIEGYEGLGVSLDGTSFTQDIRPTALKKKIAGSVDDFNKMTFRGVTLQQENINNEYKIKYDANGNALFYYDTVTDKDDNGNLNLDTNGNVIYRHVYKEAVKNVDYLEFELFFKALNTKDTQKKYNLFLVNPTDEKIGTRITANPTNVPLMANLNIPASKDKRNEAPRTSGPNVGTPIVKGEYLAGDSIELDASNAMRLGVITTDNSNINIYETPNDKDLGSSAIEGRSDALHNKDVNAMYTYYNNWNSLYSFTKAADDGDAFKTSNNYEKDADGNEYSLGLMEYDQNTSDYRIISTKIYIWLEGWDADYFMGVPVSSRNININLVFELREKPEN